MYYELRFDYAMDDHIYTPDGLKPVTDDDKKEIVDSFVQYLKTRIKDFDLDSADFDDEYVYVRFYSDEVLGQENVKEKVFGDANEYVVAIDKTVEYGSPKDWSYYEEPYYETSEVELDAWISNANILHAEDLDESKEEGCSYKKDAGNVPVGIQMFNSAMGEDLKETIYNTKYRVYYILHGGEMLYGGSNDINEAESFAYQAAKHILGMTQEDKHDRIAAAKSVFIYDIPQDIDVTSQRVEDRIEALVERTKSSWLK